jgi:hypothetical protein
MRRVAIALVLTLLIACAVASAESDIDPDRPDLSSSARTVGRGVFQLETGFAYERTREAASPVTRRLAVEAMLRVGVTDGIELRLEGEPFVRLRGPEEDTSHGDVSLGVKARLWPAPDGTPWPTFGLLAFVKPPLAESPIGTGRTDAGLIALASLELPADFSLDVNAGGSPSGRRGRTAISRRPS